MGRAVVTVRVADPAVARIDALADTHDVKRADVLRAALYVAFQNENTLKKTISEMKDRP